jgi:hypothetical protein
VDTSTPMMLFTGNAHRALAEDVAHRLGVPLGKALVGTFSDGEVQIEIEENVRRQEVFVMQPTGAPSAENLFELLALADALKRASAASVTAVIPYFGYARQDRRPRSARVPITAKLVAKMIGKPPASIACSRWTCTPTRSRASSISRSTTSTPRRCLLADIWRNYSMDDVIVVSPDVGGVVRARAMAKRLDDADLAIIDKRRPKANVATVMNIIGDVERQDLRDGGRHRRHRRHALRGCRCAEGARRPQGGRLLRASGALGRGDQQYRRLAARSAGGHQYVAAAPASARPAPRSASCRSPNCWPRRSAVFRRSPLASR